jgi:hypothetical protein
MYDTQTTEDHAIEADARKALKKALRDAHSAFLAANGDSLERAQMVMEDVISGDWDDNA